MRNFIFSLFPAITHIAETFRFDAKFKTRNMPTPRPLNQRKARKIKKGKKR